MHTCAVCGAPFHWQTRPGRKPMTCSPECRLVRKNRQSEQSRSRAAARGCPEDKHGTYSGYSHYKCGCSACSRASRLYKQERRKQAQLKP